MANAKKPQNTKYTVIQLLHYMLKYKLELAAGCICAVLTPVFSVRGTYLLKPAINDYIIPLIGQARPDLTVFIEVLLKMTMFYVLAAITTFIQTRLMTKVCYETICDIRCDMFGHMQHLPLEYYDKNPRGKIMSAYSSDVMTLTTMLKQSIPQTINGIVSIVSILFSMLTLNASLTLIVAVYIVIVVFINKFIIRNSTKYTRATQESIRDMNGLIEEMVDGQDVVKLFSKEDDVRRQFREESRRQLEANTGSKTFSGIIFPIANGLTNAGFTLVCVIGVFMIILGKTDVGTICTFIQYYKQFHTPTVQVSRQVGNIFNALAGAERIFIMLNEEYEANEGKVSRNPDTPLEKGIEIKGMTFGYDPSRAVLKNINLSVKPGQSVAFVGPSGAGKTTIANLINRFYDVNEGTITLDGTDIRDLDKYNLRSMISFVLQETHLFTGTIKDNIRFGRLEATDEEVMEAAKLVNADFFIEHLPDKYDTWLESDGDMLSEGQRQLLAIARAAVSRAPILIMDEATSSVDTRTELMIERGLAALMKNKTVFMIAHRLSTVRNADIIVVLKAGCIVECGSHEELMNLKGMYYDLNTGSSELL